ncbi:MAG: metallophosphoesterase, partial [Rhodomicrobium sp.]|nr:metallophosphoesterase [Rhodomicrobium sp.]
DASPGKARIVATHHPLVFIEGLPRARPARRAVRALEALRAEGVEMLLSGHTHQAFAVSLAQNAGRLLAVGAPTALSHRVRGEANGFWLIEIGPRAFELNLNRFDDDAFVPEGQAQSFEREIRGRDD